MTISCSFFTIQLNKNKLVALLILYRDIRICYDRYLKIELENVRNILKFWDIIDSTTSKTKDNLECLKFGPKNVQCI